MINYMVIFAAALVMAVGATPIVRLVAVKVGVVDKPGPRKLHRQAVPLLGGVAIYFSLMIAVLAFGDRAFIPQMLGILTGATLVSFLGVWDDRWGVRPVLKLCGQVAAALILVFSGVQVEFLRVPILNVAITVFWVVAITNAMNLLDNMDGLSGGVAAIAAAFFFILAAGSGQFLVASLAAALVGACLGFLRYNFNPATVFMGDTGSLFLGYVLAAVGVKLRFDHPDIVTWMIPVFVLGVPAFDTTLVIISRLRRGLNPLTTPGKDHISHRLVKLGWTHREAVMALYLLCGVCGMVALFLKGAGVLEAYVVAAVALVVAVVGTVKLEQIMGRGAAIASSSERGV